jgi:hypothetical protein
LREGWAAGLSYRWDRARHRRAGCSTPARHGRVLRLAVMPL